MAGSETDFWMMTETMHDNLHTDSSLPLQQLVSHLQGLSTAREHTRAALRCFIKQRSFFSHFHSH